MLPVKIAEVSQFEISAAKVVSPLAFRVMGHKLDRADWTAEANTEELTGKVQAAKPDVHWMIILRLTGTQHGRQETGLASRLK